MMVVASLIPAAARNLAAEVGGCREAAEEHCSHSTAAEDLDVVAETEMDLVSSPSTDHSDEP